MLIDRSGGQMLKFQPEQIFQNKCKYGQYNMLHPRGTMTQHFLWGNKPAILWGGSYILESCCELFRTWSREPGKRWTKYGGCVCTCVYFHINSDRSVKGVRISEELHMLELLAQKLVWSIYNSKQLVLNIKHRILTPTAKLVGTINI